MTDSDPDPLAEVRRQERDGARTVVEVGPFTALMLIAALQSAHQFPLFQRYGRELYWQLRAVLLPALPDDPEIRGLIRQGEPPGWRTDY